MREVASELARSELARASEQALIESRPQLPPVERMAVPVPAAPAAMERGGPPGGAPPRTATPPTFALVAGLLRGEGTITQSRHSRQCGDDSTIARGPGCPVPALQGRAAGRRR